MISNIHTNRMGTVSFDGKFAGAHGHAGTNGVVYCDNSAALEVFGSAK